MSGYAQVDVQADEYGQGSKRPERVRKLTDLSPTEAEEKGLTEAYNRAKVLWCAKNLSEAKDAAHRRYWAKSVKFWASYVVFDNRDE